MGNVDNLPIARLDVMRYIRARVIERFGGNIMIKVVIDDTVEDTQTRLEIFTPGRFLPFTVDDVDWEDPSTLADFVLSNLER